MDFNMDEETARETISRMFHELGRTFNGDYSQSESDDDLEDVPDTSVKSPAPSTPPNAQSTPPATEAQDEAPKKKSKKKKKKKKAKASKPEVGDALDMEESIDPEEVDLYDMSRSIEERIELAVTKFRKNRRFNPTRSQILSTYLDYGGIKSGQKAYQGGGLSGPHCDDGVVEPDFEMMKAGIDLVEEPKDDQVVDFTNVATTFLSEYFLYHTGWIAPEYYVETPKVIASLLNYFLVRNVVPEYKDDIAQALEVTKQASIELPLIRDISRALPGMFSKSCSMLLEGALKDVAADTDPWQGASVAADNTYGADVNVSRRVLQALLGPDLEEEQLKVVSRGFMELEVVAVHEPEVSAPSTNGGPAVSDVTAAEGGGVAVRPGPIDIGEGEDLVNNPELDTLLDQALQIQGLQLVDQNTTSYNELSDLSTLTPTTATTTATTDTADSNWTTTTTTALDKVGEGWGQTKVSDTKATATGSDDPDHVLAPPQDHWPIPVFARVELAEFDPDLPREEQKPLAERRHLSTYLEVNTANKLLMGMRFEAKVFKLAVGDLCYLEQASLKPTFYLAADIVEDEEGEAFWAL